MPHLPGIGGFVGQMALLERTVPTFISAGVASMGLATAPTPGQPAGQLAGDLLLILQSGSSGTPATPSGYTLVTNAGAVDGDTPFLIFRKIATGAAEAIPALSDQGDKNSAVVLCFRGVDPANPIDATPTVGVNNTLSSSISWPTITTTVENVLLINAAALVAGGTGARTVSGYTNAGLGSIAEIVDVTATTQPSAFCACAGTKAVAGAVAATTGTIAGGTCRVGRATFGLRGS